MDDPQPYGAPDEGSRSLPAPVGPAVSIGPMPPFGAAPADPAPGSPPHFEALRTDPPPRVIPTWWIRYAQFVTMAATGVLTLGVARAKPAGDVVRTPVVVAAHFVVIALLVAWSAAAMINAGRIVPARRYQPHPNPWTVSGLWLLAAIVPTAGLATTGELRNSFATSDSLGPAFVLVAVLFASLVALWLPFGYHIRQGRRIGAPRGRMTMWFWATLISALGGLAISGLGLREDVAVDGIDTGERLLLAVVMYGLGAFVATLATWRATTVFDEVLDIRWNRWKTEWELTMQRLAALPPPGPEPVLEG